MGSMATWAVRISWCLIAFGALLWTPVADLLPVELWLWLARLGRGSVLPGQSVYFRIVPASSGPVDPVKLLGVALVVIGLIVLFALRWATPKRQSA